MNYAMAPYRQLAKQRESTGSSELKGLYAQAMLAVARKLRARQGITLIETIIAGVLAAILLQAMLAMFTGMNFQMRKAKARIAELQSATQAANAASLKILKWTDSNVSPTSTPILCLTGNATYSCAGGQCMYVNSQWKSGGHQCDLGILFY